MKTQYILALLLFVTLLTGCAHPVTTPLANDLPNPAPTPTPEPLLSPTVLPTEVLSETDGNVVAPEKIQSFVLQYTLGDYAIVYNAFDVENPTSSPVMFINLTTGFSGPIPNTIDGWAPDLSPIDQRVAFITHNSDKDSPIYVVNVDGSNLRQ